MEGGEAADAPAAPAQVALRPATPSRRPPRRRGPTDLPQVAQVLAGLEADRLAGGNAHLGARAGVTADPLLARLHLEDAEPAQFDPLAAAHRFLHGVENRLDRHDRPHPGD